MLWFFNPQKSFTTRIGNTKRLKFLQMHPCISTKKKNCIQMKPVIFFICLATIITLEFFCYRQYIPKNKHIVIDFSEINWNDMTQLPPSPMKMPDVDSLSVNDNKL